MKNLISVLALFCCFTCRLCSQNYYVLNAGTAAYKDLNNPLIIASDQLVQGYYFADNLVFPFYGYNMNFKEDPVFSSGVYIDKDGFVVTDETSFKYTDILDIAYGNYKIRDSTTSIAVAYEGQRGKGILKIQWKNMGIEGHQKTDFVNFQIWFDESAKEISFHYGPKYISGTHNPVIGLMRASNNSDTFTHSTFVRGNTSNPSGLSVYYARKVPVYPVSGFPPDGTVYTFHSNASGLGENRLRSFAVYPNPAKDKIYFSFNDYAGKVKIYGMNGQLIIEAEPERIEKAIDISTLQKGLYMVQLDGYVAQIIAVN